MRALLAGRGISECRLLALLRSYAGSHAGPLVAAERTRFAQPEFFAF